MSAAVNPIVRGMLNGIRIASMIREQALAQEAAERLRAREQREAILQDLQTRMMLSERARPVTGGTVTEEVELDLPSGYSVASGTPETITRRQRSGIVRPADRSRTVKYGGAEYEILTPAEQAAIKRLEELRTLEEKNQRALEHAKRMREELGIEVVDPETGQRQRVSEGSVDDFYRGMASRRAAIEGPRKPTPTPRIIPLYDWATGAVRAGIASMDEQGRPKIEASDPLKGVISPRPRAQAQAKEGKERQPSQSERLNELVGRVLMDSARGGGKTIDDAIKNVTRFYQSDPAFTPGMRAAVIARLKAMAEKDPDNPFADQAQAVQPVQAPRPMEARAQQAQQIARPRPRKGETRTYRGYTYEFDGTQWIRRD